MKKRILFVLVLLFLGSCSLCAQDTIIKLWPKDKIPNYVKSGEKETHEKSDALRISKVQEPDIAVYLPAEKNATGEAVLIFPGGGYRILAYDKEGTYIAKYLNGKGIAGIVVKYRMPSSVSQTDKHLVPLIDAQRALRIVRRNAENFNIKPDKIGVIGFSAGGHLVATLGTHYDEKVCEPIDDIDNESARPDFMALGYAVIQLPEKNNKADKVVATKKEPSIMAYFANYEKVTAETPPALLFHAADDSGVPVANSLDFFRALHAKGVAATMHIYPTGGHGFSLARDNAHLQGWPDRFFEWIESLE